ncbi:unnamed protein product [Heligmosomoides polygyrus]|uniref:Uncharacterized protein n=1 Tax=Heligmosomoides polygyrus TaxID=6339 RepID=A0A3P8EC89_HELPZ|nr:unnamed protein product [Heligmosomoides polygyrus]
MGLNTSVYANVALLVLYSTAIPLNVFFIATVLPDLARKCLMKVKLLIATMTVVHIIWCFTWLSLSLTVLLIEVVWELLFSIVQVSAFMRCLPKHVYVLSYYETLIEEFCEALSARLR